MSSIGREEDAHGDSLIRLEASACCRCFDQRGQALESRPFLLGTDDPPVHLFAIPSRLRLKEFPCRLISFQLSQIRLDQFRAALFVRIDSGSVFFPRCKRLQASRLHSILFEKFLDVPHIHGAPNAACFARGETNHVTLFIDALANTIDPTKAERFIDGLRPGNTRFP